VARGNGRGEAIKDCTGTGAACDDDVRSGRFTGGEREAQFEAAEETLGVSAGSKDDDETGIEQGLEETRRKLFAILNVAGIEEGDVAEAGFECFGIGFAGAASVGDEDWVSHLGNVKMRWMEVQASLLNGKVKGQGF